MRNLAPWGAHRPGGVARLLLRLCRGVPDWPLVRQAAFPLRRLARRTLGPVVDYQLWGFRLRLRSRGNLAEGRLLFFPHRWDPVERAFLHRHLRPGATVVDVGANAGAYTWWVLHITGGDCTVLALEPDPELRDLFAFNLATNAIDAVRLSGDAAGTSDGEAILARHPVNRGQNRLLSGAPGDVAEPGSPASVRVRVRPLPDLVREAGLARIDLLKIDIEGLEPPVLEAFYRHAPPDLWPRILIVEDAPSPEHRALKLELETRGYRLACSTKRNLVLVRHADPR